MSAGSRTARRLFCGRALVQSSSSPSRDRRELSSFGAGNISAAVELRTRTRDLLVRVCGRVVPVMRAWRRVLLLNMNIFVFRRMLNRGVECDINGFDFLAVVRSTTTAV